MPPEVLYTPEISGMPSRVTLDFQPGGIPAATIPSVDDGTSGDWIANDRTYSARVPSRSIVTALRPDDVHRVFVGYLNIVTATGAAPNRYSLCRRHRARRADVSDRPAAPNVQATSRLVNISDPALFSSNDLTRITRELYRWFADDYDFFTILDSPARLLNRTESRDRET